jgi:hypothetical protein
MTLYLEYTKVVLLLGQDVEKPLKPERAKAVFILG